MNPIQVLFVTEPQYEDMPNGIDRKIISDWYLFINGIPVIIHCGFITDCASVPRFLWSIIPPIGRYTKAAILHDYLYRKGIFTKEQADKIFLEAMIILDCSVWKRNAMYAGVKVGGGKAWKHYRKGGK
jgi:hypothetical protein